MCVCVYVFKAYTQVPERKLFESQINRVRLWAGHTAVGMKNIKLVIKQTVVDAQLQLI